MQQLQRQYNETLYKINHSKIMPPTKIHLLETLISQIKDQQNSPKFSQPSSKYKQNYQILSTSISECQSINYQSQKDIEQLQQKILKMRMVKFQNNEDIETIEEELFEMEKIVKAREEFNQYMKKQIDMKMLSIQQESDRNMKKKEDKSVLNKSLDAVTNVFKGKWWG